MGMRLCLCGQGAGGREPQPSCSSQTHFPGPLPSLPPPPLLPKAPTWGPHEGRFRGRRDEEHDFLSRKFPANQPLCLFLVANAFCMDSRVLATIPASPDNTVNTLQPGGKSIPFQQQESESLATHSFNILVDNMPWTQSIFHFLFVPFPVISKAFIKSIKT